MVAPAATSCGSGMWLHRRIQTEGTFVYVHLRVCKCGQANMCLFVACTCIQCVQCVHACVLMYTGLCTCVSMHVHVCLVCSALLSSVFEKFIRRQAVPEGMESTVVFPAHGAAWVYALPCLRALGLTERWGVGLPANLSLLVPCPAPTRPFLHSSSLLSSSGWDARPSQAAGVGWRVLPLGPVPLSPRVGAPFHAQGHLLHPPP